MESIDIRKKFLDFFKSKGHAVVKSSSLRPDDPSVLLTTAGMQQFKRYYTGELDPVKDFGSKRTTSAQKCFRTSDIEEVGDRMHLTFFEMLGNFCFGTHPKSTPRPRCEECARDARRDEESVAAVLQLRGATPQPAHTPATRGDRANCPHRGVTPPRSIAVDTPSEVASSAAGQLAPIAARDTFGMGSDYWKKEAISWAYEFVTEVLGIAPDRITVTVFAGDADVPFDKESYDIWRNAVGLPEARISKQGRKDNFWGPTGNEGPCGPTTEIYAAPTSADAMAGKGIEIWNIVFNEFYCHKDKTLEKSKTPGIDTGMGLERLTAMLQGVDTVFETDLFRPLMDAVNAVAAQLDDRTARIFADHIRASVFLIADGVRPSNKEAGYILRRLLRRVMAYAVKNDVHGDVFLPALQAVQETLGKIYPEIMKTGEIAAVINDERDKFAGMVANGLKELSRHAAVGAKEAFYIYESFGLPFELITELGAKEAVVGLKREDFDKEFAKHREISRAGAEKKFGGHGLVLDTGELKAKDDVELQKVVRLHTATHLMQAALREVLGKDVAQKGSDITAERTRFDFSFPRKVTPEEIKKVEEIVNKRIGEDLPVAFQELPKDEAAKTGALHFFNVKYPEKVKVYYIGHSLKDAYSKEFCGGPHVDHTLIIGKFKILKEEAVSSGVRRIRATVE